MKASFAKYDKMDCRQRTPSRRDTHDDLASRPTNRNPLQRTSQVTPFSSCRPEDPPQGPKVSSIAGRVCLDISNQHMDPSSTDRSKKNRGCDNMDQPALSDNFSFDHGSTPSTYCAPPAPLNYADSLLPFVPPSSTVPPNSASPSTYVRIENALPSMTLDRPIAFPKYGDGSSAPSPTMICSTRAQRTAEHPSRNTCLNNDNDTGHPCGNYYSKLKHHVPPHSDNSSIHYEEKHLHDDSRKRRFEPDNARTNEYRSGRPLIAPNTGCETQNREQNRSLPHHYHGAQVGQPHNNSTRCQETCHTSSPEHCYGLQSGHHANSHYHYASFRPPTRSMGGSHDHARLNDTSFFMNEHYSGSSTIIYGNHNAQGHAVDIDENDVLCGRGGATNGHPGNRRFRALVQQHKQVYLNATKKEKPRVAAAIVNIVRSREGRFLKKEGMTSMWYDVGDVKAREKTCQALREGAPATRKTMSSASDKAHGDENPAGRAFSAGLTATAEANNLVGGEISQQQFESDSDEKDNTVHNMSHTKKKCFSDKGRNVCE